MKKPGSVEEGTEPGHAGHCVMQQKEVTAAHHSDKGSRGMAVPSQ